MRRNHTLRGADRQTTDREKEILFTKTVVKDADKTGWVDVKKTTK